MLKKVNDEDTKENLKNAVFSQFLSRPAGDLTRYIRKINDISDTPKHLENYLEEQLPIVEQICEKLEESDKNVSKKNR